MVSGLNLIPKKKGWDRMPSCYRIPPGVELELRRDDLESEDLQRLYDDFGPELVVQLVRGYGGLCIQVPKRGLLGYINRMVEKEFDGSNYRALARKYAVSERHVRNIISLKTAA
jgi:Mor family transcriptional regulator